MCTLSFLCRLLINFSLSDITRYFMQQLGKNEVEIGIELQKVGRSIGQKIQDLKRPTRPKKGQKLKSKFIKPKFRKYVNTLRIC